MRKSLVNHQLRPTRPNAFARILLALFTMLLAPNMAWAEDYNLRIKDSSDGSTIIQVSDDNKDNLTQAIATASGYGITTEGTITFNPSTNTLNLTAACINRLSGNPAFYIESGLDKLTIHCVSGGEIKTPYNNALISTNSNAELVIECESDDINPSELFITSNVNAISGFAKVTLGTGTYLQSESPVYYDETEKKYMDSVYPTTANVSAVSFTTDVCYPVWVDYSQVNANNIDDVTGYSTVSFTPTPTPTLKLNSFATGEASYIVSGLNNLTIEFQGNNAIGNNEGGAPGFIQSTDPSAVLTFKGVSGNDGSPSTLNIYNADDPVITGFASLALDNAYYQNTYPVRYNTTDKVFQQSNVLSWSESHNITITTAQTYQLWVGFKQVTSANASTIHLLDDIFSGTITFADNTLTLNNSKITMTSDYPAIVSGLDNLTVQLTGENEIDYTNYGQRMVYSTNPTATLTFSASETGAYLHSNITAPDYVSAPAGGFTTTNYNNDLMFIANGTTNKQYVTNPVPVITTYSIQNPYFVADDGMSLVYSIDYVDETTQDITNATYNTGGTLNIDIDEPCTITAHVEYGSLSSTTATAKFYEIKDKTIVWSNDYADGTTEFSASSLECTPAIQDGDGVALKVAMSSNEDVIEYDGTTEKAYIKGLGETTIDVSFGQGNSFAVLNEAGQATVSIVPPAPTIVKDNTKDYLNTDYITITQTIITGADTDILYTWEEGAGATWHDYDYATGVPAQTGTLRAKVYSESEDVESAEATPVAFTVKTDISGCTVDGLPESASYTGSTIVLPAFSVMVSPTATASLTAGTDYTVSYKKVGQGAALTDMTSMVDIGSYKIVITGTGNYGGSAMVDFEITKANLNIVTIEAIADQTYTGSEIELDAVTVKLNSETINADEYEITGYANNKNVSTTTKATVTITAKSTSEHFIEGSTKTAEFNIVAKTLTENMVTLSATTLDYNNESQTPTVTVKDGETNLSVGTDYEVSYKQGETVIDENDIIDASTYTVVVTGKGNYTGNASQTFTITPMDLAGLGVEVAAIDDKTYTGSEITPEPEVSYLRYLGQDQWETITLVAGTDFEYSYENNVAAATYNSANAPKVIVTGKGNYSGTLEQSFTIAQISAIITAQNKTVTYNGAAQAYDGATVDKGSIIITYYLTEDDRDAGSKGFTDAPTNAATYYVQVTQGDANYTADAANVTFTIEQLDITDATVTLDNTTLEYNGSNQTVNVTKVMAGTIEVSSNYYTVSGNTQKDADTYTVTVTAKTDIANNFTGRATTTFTIKKRTKSASDFNFQVNSYVTFYDANEDWLLPEGLSAYIVTGVGETEITTTQVSYIKKGVPVLVKNAAGANINDTNEATGFDGNKLKYAADAVSATGKEYVLYKDAFVKATLNTNIPQGKCYLDLGTNAARASYGISHGDGDNTGIKDVMMNEDQDGKWYDLQGRRIEKPTKKGLYIRNGKTVVINNK